MIHADMAPLQEKATAQAGPAAWRFRKAPVQPVPSRTRFSDDSADTTTVYSKEVL